MDGLRRLLEPYYREAEFWLLNAPEKERELEEKRMEIIETGTSELVRAVPEKGHYSDPTGEKARRLAELEREERWLELVREVERTPFGDLIRLRREYGRASKKNPVWLRLARRMHYSERWLRQRWKEIVYYTAFLAVNRGIAKKEAVYLKKKVL